VTYSPLFVQALLRRVMDEKFIPEGVTFSRLPKELKKKELNDFNEMFPGLFSEKADMTKYISRHMINH
jgi:hypothetical protein